MKRIFDVVLSIILLIVLILPMLLIALLIRFTSDGQALYWSDRVGKNGVVFKMPKFLFSAIALLSPNLSYKMDKLLGDECYSSEKLESLGFKARKQLKQMNETDF